MKISSVCFVLFLSRVLSYSQTDIQLTRNDKCIFNVSEASRKLFNMSIANGDKVIFFRIHYNSDYANNLTKPRPDDHFANPNGYMWLYDGENGLPVYMNTPYDFEVRSLLILKEYTSVVSLNINVSKSCNGSNVSRINFLRLAFEQLIQVVSPAPLPDTKASAYVCYSINNRKNMSDSEFMAYQRAGQNRRVILRYCCKVKDHTSYDNSTDLCRGKVISTADTINLQTVIGFFLFLFFPLAIGFISRAKLNHHRQPFSLIHSVSTSFEYSRSYLPPFGTSSSWLNERDPYFSILHVVRWLLLFEKRSAFASRVRRSLAVISCLVVIFADVTLQNYTIKQELEAYLENNAPLGYRSMIFGYKKSIENTGNFLGGPFIWLSGFVVLGLIVINIPDRLCQTIAYSTLHQKDTCTFLAKDIKLLQTYGSLNASELLDYELLHAIMKASLLTGLNPSFWYAIIKQWISRCKRLYHHFNNSNIVYQLIGVCVISSFAFISIFLCIFELLLSIIYYCCPVLQICKAIPYSYTQCYICPLFRHTSFNRKILGVLCFILSLPVYTFLFIFTFYIFENTFELISLYTIYTVIALVAKPDAIAFVFLFLLFVYFLFSIANSISETYLSLQRLSITLAPKVCKDFVYIRLEERLIYRELFGRIVQQHHPIRFEITKALIKLFAGVYILTSCAYAFENITMNMSAYIKIGLLVFTSMIPKFMSVLKDTMLESRWKALPILETIWIFQQDMDFPNCLKAEIDV